MYVFDMFFFFFSSRRRHTRSDRDWSSDVCSSDLVADISQIPPYNEDVRAQGFPPTVETLRRQIAGADALLFACPEYNYSMSGVLKNAIDWASRPPDQPFAGKPCAIIGAA